MALPSLLARDTALRHGVVTGTALGVCWVAYSLVNNLLPLDATGNAWLNNGATAALVLGFGLAGGRAAQQTGQVSAGTRAGLWTWLISSAVGLVTLWIGVFVFWSGSHQDPRLLADYARSGAASLDAFLIDDTLGASTVGLGAVLVLSVGVSTLAGLLGWSLRRRPPAAL